MVELALKVVIDTGVSPAVTLLEGVVHREGEVHTLNMDSYWAAVEELEVTRYWSM